MYFGKNPLLIVFVWMQRDLGKNTTATQFTYPLKVANISPANILQGLVLQNYDEFQLPKIYFSSVLFIFLLGNTNIKVAKLNNDFQIPLLNTTHNHLLQEGQLVRFQGMIQDMYNPVYYLATYEVHNTITNEKIIRSGKYKDSLECAVSVLLVILFHLFPQLK